jgi:hypothetical protein
MNHARIAATTAALACVFPAAADGLDSLVTGGKVGLELRYRMEAVEQDGLPRDALANTARLRLDLESGPIGDFAAFVEFDHLEALGTERFNSTRNGRTDYPVVADPEGTDLNQLYLRYDGLADTVVKLGRQRLVLDNQRFIGNVGWRQNEQTFDAFSVQSKALTATTLTYAYIDNVRRVFGPENGLPPAELDSRSHVLHAAWAASPFGALSVYHYRLDFRNAPALSSAASGLRVDGSAAAGRGRVTWKAEYARQSDVGDNPAAVSADYWLLEAGYQAKVLGAAVGYEVLGGEAAAGPNRAFQTPLATLHAFQGWADKFLTTPPAGIEDRYVALRAQIGRLKAELLWHDFSAEATAADYGRELDLSLAWPLGPRYQLLAKYADYAADELFTGTRKAWLQFTAGF